MNAIAKLVATFMIWACFTIIMTAGSSPVSQAMGGTAVIMTVVLAIAASASTAAIWQSGEKTESHSAEKAKRTHTRVARFVDRLSDDEIAELRSRLMADDGEVVPLDELLRTREQDRR